MATEGNPALVDDWVVENYDAIVADENRATSYDDIAKHAEHMDDPHLAAWARKRAAEAGKKVAPAKEPESETVTREEKPAPKRSPRRKAPVKPKPAETAPSA